MNISNTNLPKHPGLFLIIKKLYEVEALKAARRYIKTAKKINCLCQHLAFNQRCARYHIIPRYLYQKPPVPSADGYKIAHSTGLKYLSARIKLDRYRLHQLKHDQFFQLRKLQTFSSPPI